MQTIMANARGLSVLAALSMDRLFCLAVVAVALATGAWLCSITLL